MTRRARTGSELLVAALLLALTGCARRSAPPPIVLISVDTLRADRLPAYGYGGVETPAIDALRRDSVLYENAYSQSPLTLPSHASLLTGLLPYENGVRDNVGFRLDPMHTTLASRLKARGYATGASVSSFALRRDRGLAAGFDLYDDSFGTASTDERAGPETVERLETWIAKTEKQPLFLFLHLYEPHTPYAPPEPFRSRYAARPYDGEVAAADAAVGGFLELLKRRGLYDPALILFLSDHGEGLGDHGEEEHGVFLYREAIRVPLLVKFPRGRAAGETITEPVGLLDVFPTVTEAAGLEKAPATAGVSLSKKGDAARRIYSETLYPRLQLGWSELASLTDGRWSYIEAPRPELYDLVADPRQRRDLAGSRPPAFRSMRAALESLVRAPASPEASSAEDLARLGSLGYIRIAPGGSGKSLPDPKDRVEALRGYKRLFDLFYEKKHEEALALARRIGNQEPAILSVARVASVCLERLGRTAEAAGVLETTLARDDVTGSAEDLSQSYVQLASLRRQAGDRAGAERGLRAGLARGVTTEEVRRELARLLVEAGRGAEALPILPAAPAANAESLDLSGVALAEAGRYQDARRAFLRATELDPGDADPLFHLGMLELREKRPAAARDWFDKALRANPDAPGVLTALGTARAAAGDEEGAFQAWKRAFDLDQSQLDALFNLAILEGRRGRAGEARKALARFVQLAPPERYAAQIAQARRLLSAIPVERPTPPRGG